MLLFFYRTMLRWNQHHSVQQESHRRAMCSIILSHSSADINLGKRVSRRARIFRLLLQDNYLFRMKINLQPNVEIYIVRSYRSSAFSSSSSNICSFVVSCKKISKNDLCEKKKLLSSASLSSRTVNP